MTRREGLGSALRRAWVGYQRWLDGEMAAAGFPDRRFPDGRVMRLCSRSEGMTASQIGRELGITRQGAGKIVAGLRSAGFVDVGPSPDDRREKVVTLASRGRDYLAAQREAVRRIDQDVERQLGPEAQGSLDALLDALGGGDTQPRMRDYLRRAARRGDDFEEVDEP